MYVAIRSDVWHAVLTKDSNGETALHYASNRGNLDAVLLLLVNGADSNAKSSYGETPIGVACTDCYNSDNVGNSKAFMDILERWPVLMTIKMMQTLRVFQWADLAMMDLYGYIGQEKDFLLEARPCNNNDNDDDGDDDDDDDD